MRFAISFVFFLGADTLWFYSGGSGIKNGKAAGKDEITGGMVKSGGDRLVDWIWRVCNMAFESGVMPEDWRSTVIASLYKDKGEMMACSNYWGISVLSMVVKIYAGILVNSL